MIGVFDSGLGGLTVLKSLMKRMPYENFVYLGDTARLPYGTKSSQTILNYTEQNLHFLQSQNVDRVVIACNSASAQYPKSNFNGMPVHTVIEPTSQVAAEITKNKKVGLLATRATVGSHAYNTFLKKIDPEIELFAQAAPLLVPLAEEGLDQDPLTNLIVYRYVQPLVANGVDTLILGCTHYPLLAAAIARAAGPKVNLVESGEAVANILYDELKKSATKDTGSLKIFTTDSLGHFREWAEKILSPIKCSSWELTDLKP